MCPLSTFIVVSLLPSIITGTLAFPSKKGMRKSFPDYVLTYAPLSHLHSEEGWWASDVTNHLKHVSPQVDSVNITNSVNINSLNSISADAYLTSHDDPNSNPAWLLSTENTPDAKRHSFAPATIICVEKEGGIIDAFYFYFYSYNHGPALLNVNWGNHVGDWEHSMIRFVNGVPQNVYLSAHSGGYAYTFDAMEKIDGRPVTYIATGSHANYATAGKQEYFPVLPFGIISDYTDAGPLWDVTLNFRGYWFDVSSQKFIAAKGAGIGGLEQLGESVDWLYWLGKWGDEQYPNDDPRQLCALDLACIFVSGPTGPFDKNLDRVVVCQDEDSCEIRDEVSVFTLSPEELAAAGTINVTPEQLAALQAAIQSKT